MFNKICFYFLVFIIYSFLGWSIEVIGKLIEKKKFINRGFLIGPLCPIYGWGSLFIYFILNRYQDNLIVLFVFSIIICSILEYATSYFMEKIFKTRWWDYTRRKFNINGRICAETMIPFGIGAVFIIKVMNPLVFSLINKLSPTLLIIISSIIFVIYIVDSIISFKVIFNFRGTIKSVEKDATEEITKKVREIFQTRGYFSRRLIKAFPSMIRYDERIEVLKNKINEELNNWKEKTGTTIKKVKNSIDDTKKIKVVNKNGRNKK